MFVFESQIILQAKQTNAGLSEKEARYFHIQTSSIRSKDPAMIVRIFLFQRAHIQYRDIFIFKHFAFTSEMF